MNKRLPCYLILLLMFSCDRPTQTEPTKTTQKYGIYFQNDNCWIENHQFKGAIARYTNGSATDIVLINVSCIDAKRAKFSDITTVRAQCIEGISGLRSCSERPATELLKEENFSIGIDPEFPNDIWAVSGKIGRTAVLNKEGRIISSVRVDNYQRMPKETYSDFMRVVDARSDYVDFYLMNLPFDRNGYRITK